MPNLNITNIPAPRVPFIDERTGLMAREWYRFFLNLFVLTGSGNNPITLEELQIGPPNQPDLAELLIQINQNIAPQYEDQSGDFLATLDTAQLMSMMARFENAEAAIQGAYLQPVVQTGTIANYNLDGSPTAGGIAYGTGPALAVSAAGTLGQVLTSAGAGTPTWTTNASGDVSGPASSTDNAIARFNGITGKLIQNSLVIVDDTGSVTGVNSLTAESLTVNNNSTLGFSNTDTLDVRARIISDLEPNTNNAKDIGTSGRNWRDGFFGRNLDTVNLSVTGTTSFDGAQGTTGQVLTSSGTGATPTWATPTTGTVTSVAALTLGTSGTDLTSTVANGTTTPVITLQVPTASASNRGALSSTDWSTFNSKGSGTVTTVGFTGGIVTVANPTTTPAFTIAGTSGGIPYFSSASTWASSAALAAGSLVLGGGAGATPATTATGTGVVTALGVNTGTAGAFVVNGGALGTPSSGTVTNLTGTASININGTVGATTATTGAFTTLSATGNATITKNLPALVLQPNAGTYSNLQMRGNSTIALGLDILAGAQNAYFSADTFTFRNAAQSANYGVFSSTGLAVTGTLSATGVVIHPAGTVALPSITTSGDLNTGVYFPAADTVGITTAATERVRIDSSGNVGIGATANASAILDAQSTTKGVRMPNMTTTQKNAIASPAAGLMVFDTTLAKLAVYSGTAWETITSI